MVYKKYVKRGGRVFGPYYYESYRDGDVVKKRYLGTSLGDKQSSESKVAPHLTYFLFLLLFVLVFVIGLYFFGFLGELKFNPFLVFQGKEYGIVKLETGYGDPGGSPSGGGGSPPGGGGDSGGGSGGGSGGSSGGTSGDATTGGKDVGDTLTPDLPDPGRGPLLPFGPGVKIQPGDRVVEDPPGYPKGTYVLKTEGKDYSSFDFPFVECGVLNGDVNGDGRVDITDIVNINDYVNHGRLIRCPQNADFNHDGVIDINDSQALANYLLLGQCPEGFLLEKGRCIIINECSNEDDLDAGGIIRCIDDDAYVCGPVGDVNGDNIVSCDDVGSILSDSFSEGFVCPQNADVNGDGVITRLDADRLFDSLNCGGEDRDPENPFQCPPGYFFQTGYGCQESLGCVLNYECTAITSCENGMREERCVDLACDGETTTQTTECSLEPCVPVWECSDWSACVNGISTRECVDLNNCNVTIDEPSELKNCRAGVEELCIPDIECGDWGECEYVDEAGNVLEGEISAYGARRRECVDLNECIPTYEEETGCESFEELGLSPQRVCGDDFLTLFTEEGTPVSYISIIPWREEGRFVTKFIQGETDYCDFCYDAIKNEGEELIDCGGPCKPCVLEKRNYMIYLMIVLWGVGIALAGLLFWRRIEFIKRVAVFLFSEGKIGGKKTGEKKEIGKRRK